MKRREAISTVGLLVGGTLVSAQVVLSGCKPRATSQTGGPLSSDQIAFMDEVGETILPKTNASPGAKEAKVGEYMNVMIRDCYSPSDRKRFMEGISQLDKTARDKFGSGFMDLDPSQRHDLLLAIHKESAGDENHYYPLFRELTMSGFYTSEIGETIAMAHVAVPGRFDPCIPLEKNQRAWS